MTWKGMLDKRVIGWKESKQGLALEHEMQTVKVSWNLEIIVCVGFC